MTKIRKKTINGNIMTFRKKSQTALDNAKKLDKFFLISANVYSEKWEVNFSEDLKYNEIIVAFTFCAQRLTSNLNDSEKKEWIAKFFSLFPQNKEKRDQQFETLNNPEIMIENKNDFVLFTVDFSEGSCDLKSNCSLTIITQVIYWAYQMLSKQLGNDSIVDLLNTMKKFGLITENKYDNSSSMDI